MTAGAKLSKKEKARLLPATDKQAGRTLKMKDDTTNPTPETSEKREYPFTVDDLIRVAERVFPHFLEHSGNNDHAARDAFRAAEAFLSAAVEYKEVQ